MRQYTVRATPSVFYYIDDPYTSLFLHISIFAHFSGVGWGGAGVRPMCPRSYVSIALCVQDSMCPGSYVARIFTISYGSYVSEFLCVPVSKWPGVRC